MITQKMAVAFLDTLDWSTASTDSDAAEVTAWLALIYPLLGGEGMAPYAAIPLVADFLKAPQVAGFDAILTELEEYYCGRCGHKVKPGIQVAKLDSGYYASVQVFPTNTASRTIIAKANEPSSFLAIQKAYEVWKKNAADAEAEVAARRATAPVV